MPLTTTTANVTLLDADGTALQGAEVRYRIGAPIAADSNQNLVNESVLDGRTKSVRTNSAGLASWVMPTSTVVYVTIPHAGIWDHRLTSPGTAGGTWLLANDLNLPAPS